MTDKKNVASPKRHKTVSRHKPAKRRRRIGAVALARKKSAQTGLIDVLMVAGGAVGGSFLDKLIPATWDTKMKGAVKIAAGIFLPQLVKDPKTKHTMQLLGYGLAANGGIQLATGFNLVSGVGATAPGLKDDDLLVVSLDGVDDRILKEQNRKAVGEYTDFEDVLNDDILNGGNIPVVEDDGNIPVVEDDILNAFA